MTFAKRVFFWSGVYGIIVLCPMLFLETHVAEAFPPATNHPEQYYGFIAVALAFQFVFLLIARDPVRYRAFMIPAMAEKFLPAGAAPGLFAVGRLSGVSLAPFLVDFVLGTLFALSWYLTSKRRHEQP